MDKNSILNILTDIDDEMILEAFEYRTFENVSMKWKIIFEFTYIVLILSMIMK